MEKVCVCLLLYDIYLFLYSAAENRVRVVSKILNQLSSLVELSF